MRLQTDRKIEIIRLTEQAPGLYSEAKDSDDPTMRAPAINEGREFAPDFEARPGDLLLIKVLE
jgi:hypothetical protein